MQIVVKKRAINQLMEIVDYGKDQFGERVAIDYYNKIKTNLLQLQKHPELGSPEPLLADRAIAYRSLIVAKHHKAIYSIDTKKETINIVDIWDMRREPISLSRRIKSKKK